LARVKLWSRSLLAALVALLCLAQAASAAQVTVRKGSVAATLSYSRNPGGYGFKFGHLEITRRGVSLYDKVPKPRACGEFECGPTIGIDGFPPLRVRNIDGDAAPEVLLTAFTGGAHCCVVAEVLELNGGASGYEPFSRNFGNGGFRLADPNHDGRPEFVSTDEAFAYRFTAYAFSGRPILIERYEDDGVYTDVTDSYPRLIRRDAKAYWGGYLQLRKHHDNTARGQIAAWAADQYRLFKRPYALRVLKREAKRGFLGSSPVHGLKFVERLDNFLRDHGYGPPTVQPKRTLP
jgi:hypothetical protein